MPIIPMNTLRNLVRWIQQRIRPSLPDHWVVLSTESSESVRRIAGLFRAAGTGVRPFSERSIASASSVLLVAAGSRDGFLLDLAGAALPLGDLSPETPLGLYAFACFGLDAVEASPPGTFVSVLCYDGAVQMFLGPGTGERRWRKIAREIVVSLHISCFPSTQLRDGLMRVYESAFREILDDLDEPSGDLLNAMFIQEQIERLTLISEVTR